MLIYSEEFNLAHSFSGQWVAAGAGTDFPAFFDPADLIFRSHRRSHCGHRNILKVDSLTFAQSDCEGCVLCVMLARGLQRISSS
ncbi:hypothetical protein Zmor_007558 [Zophobas morio]|uniref:Uncharacterized protein n=1 Tax=Zophobas morio TaxID=2755281 RepID=A0AA38IUB1_9CUCU|nr:hypothetical protein Zmor_007558 [Zophobas morio]